MAQYLLLFAEYNQETQNRRLSSLLQKSRANTGKLGNLGTFGTREAAETHERAIQFFKRAH